MNFTEQSALAWWSELPEVVQQRWLADSKTPTMDDAWAESRRRQGAANFSLASVRLEGFNPSAYVREQSRRHINGEINMQEFLSKPVAHTYQIDPRPEALGGGWKLQLLEDGEEVGGGVFEAGDDGYSDALETAQDWLSSYQD